jgi:biopolymer transport protein ExbD
VKLWNLLPKASHAKLFAMTEINSNHRNFQKGGFAKSKKLSVRIDMTPMVDLGFLLITFFIFTSTMSQPTSMNLIIPKEAGEPMPVKESGVLTILPGENRQIYHYEGFYKQGNVRDCSLKEIRNIIVNKKRKTPEKDFFVIIKPSKSAHYGDIVDILDEMTISDVKRYALVNITPHEETFLK